MSKNEKKTVKHNCYYTNAVWNIIIYSTITIVLLGISFIIFISFKGLLINVFQVEQAVGDMVSLVVSILFFVFPLIPKIKHLYIKLVNTLRQRIYKQLRKGTLTKNIHTTAEQAIIINRALEFLQNNEGHLIALESGPSKGKTMTAVLLIDNIGRDENLLELFIQLQQHICYIDAGYEKSYLLSYLDDNTVAAKSLTIVDNVHKLSSETFITVLNKITSIAQYASSIGSKHLIILLYQSIDNNSTNRLLNEYLNGQNTNSSELFFKLNSNSHCSNVELRNNQKIDADYFILNKIRSIQNELLSAHLLRIYVYANTDTLINFLLKILYDRDIKICLDETLWLQLIAIIVILSMHLGFVTKDDIIKVWKNLLPRYGKTHCLRCIKNLSKNKFLLPFPLIKNAFLFNESLAHEYKKKLFSIPVFREYYYQCADYLYTSKFFNAVDLEWLFLIACKPCKIQTIPEIVREKQFYSCIESMNKRYVLTALEEEIALDKQKQLLFQLELGVLYIKTGLWSKARQVLKPYISKEKALSKIYQLQLQIIEADHGVDDDENLIILNKITNLSDDPYIQFQAQYWTAHIKMEQGDFSTTVWADLQAKIEANSIWKARRTYPHLIHRITADACRTFFLQGSGDFKFFNQTLEFFKTYRLKPNLQEDLALEELENAHYIHYELVYQLGIWKIYHFQHDRSRSLEDSLCINDLIKEALKLYDKSIAQFLNSGVKTWRTAQIRRAELSLCGVSPNYIEILSQLDDFEHYAIENSVDVFNGYVACLQGKAFAIYALNEALGKEDNSYERSLENSLMSFKESIQIYNNYGNTFGALRSKMLYVLVNTIKMVSEAEDYTQILEYLNIELLQIKKSISAENKREQQVIMYLTTMPSLKIADIGNVIKYYPIVLQ